MMVAVEASALPLKSDLGKTCALIVDLEEGLQLKSDLGKWAASECSMAVDWEPTLASKLALECVAIVAVEASALPLKSDLGKTCARVIDLEESLQLKSELGKW